MLGRWNKDQIALEIMHLYTIGEPLNYGQVQKNQLRLLRAATRYFGSWQAAVEYAGLDYDRIRRYQVWTKERIVEQIGRYFREGHDLSWRHVSTELDPPLAAAAIRANRYGSWQAALEASGLAYEDIRRNRCWDEGAIVEELKRLHAEGASLRVSDASVERPALVAAARRRFEGWYEAVTAAGLDEWEARRGLSDEYDEEMIRGEASWIEERSRQAACG